MFLKVTLDDRTVLEVEVSEQLKMRETVLKRELARAQCLANSGKVSPVRVNDGVTAPHSQRGSGRE